MYKNLILILKNVKRYIFHDLYAKYWFHTKFYTFLMLTHHGWENTVEAGLEVLIATVILHQVTSVNFPSYISRRNSKMRASL